MKASELRAMQAQYMSGNYTPRRTETNERPMVSRASNRQVSYLTDLKDSPGSKPPGMRVINR